MFHTGGQSIWNQEIKHKGLKWIKVCCNIHFNIMAIELLRLKWQIYPLRNSVSKLYTYIYIYIYKNHSPPRTTSFSLFLTIEHRHCTAIEVFL